MKIFNCLEGMRQQIRLRSIKFLLLGVLSLWLLAPAVVSAQVVEIPDPNLRAALAEALNKAPGDAITRAEMETLVELRASNREITDLRGIEFAINLTGLGLGGNNISDISPVASLTNLHWLYLWRNTISDIPAMPSLTNLRNLHLDHNSISDISPLASLTNLTWLGLGGNNISDIPAMPSLTNLHWLYLWENSISDISAVASLTNLTGLGLGGNNISDISPVASLTNLHWLDLWGNSISDISAVASLTNLESLYLGYNSISDISPLASLTNLLYLHLQGNEIRDVFPLIGLINLRDLRLADNPIEDVLPLEVMVAQNPDLSVDLFWPPKITGPWLWMIAPTEIGLGGAKSLDVDSLADASGGTVTETDVATNGAIIGERVGNYAWTPAELADTGGNNINDVVNNIGFAQGDVNDHSSYALINFTSATALSGVRMHVGSNDAIKVWLNGEVVFSHPVNRGAHDFQDMFRVDLVAGENLLLVKVSEGSDYWSMFVGIDADFTVLPFSPTPPPPPPPPAGPSLDVNGDGRVDVLDLVWVAVSYGMRGPALPMDINADGVVNVQDLVAVAEGIDAGAVLPAKIAEDVLLAAEAAAAEFQGVAEAPMMGFNTSPQVASGITAYGNVAAALADAKSLVSGDVRLGKWLPLLEELLRVLAEMKSIPETTALLPNYPNPFNPETWIPYELAKDAEVTVTIYDVRGGVIRQLLLGYQRAGVYMSRGRAAYWDGRNQIGEPVASGVYFYTLAVEDFSATRRMLILK